MYSSIAIFDEVHKQQLHDPNYDAFRKLATSNATNNIFISIIYKHLGQCESYSIHAYNKHNKYSYNLIDFLKNNSDNIIVCTIISLLIKYYIGKILEYLLKCMKNKILCIKKYGCLERMHTIYIIKKIDKAMNLLDINKKYNYINSSHKEILYSLKNLDFNNAYRLYYLTTPPNYSISPIINKQNSIPINPINPIIPIIPINSINPINSITPLDWCIKIGEYKGNIKRQLYAIEVIMDNFDHETINTINRTKSRSYNDFYHKTEQYLMQSKNIKYVSVLKNFIEYRINETFDYIIVKCKINNINFDKKKSVNYISKNKDFNGHVQFITNLINKYNKFNKLNKCEKYTNVLKLISTYKLQDAYNLMYQNKINIFSNIISKIICVTNISRQQIKFIGRRIITINIKNPINYVKKIHQIIINSMIGTIIILSQPVVNNISIATNICKNIKKYINKITSTFYLF